MSRLVNDNTVLSCNGLLIEDNRRCSTLFNQLSYSHIKRKCNKVAHSLARYVAHISDFLVWIEDVLPQILFVV